MVVSSKSCKFRANRWFFVIFYEMSHFFHLFAEKLTNTLKHGSFIEKLQALGKSMIFRAFWRNERLLASFCWKVHQNAETWQFCRKVASLGKIDDFSCIFSKWATFWNFSLKSWPKRRNMVVSSKSCKFWPNRWFFVLFREMSHFLQLFAEKLTKRRNMIVSSKSCKFWPNG